MFSWPDLDTFHVQDSREVTLPPEITSAIEADPTVAYSEPKLSTGYEAK